MLLDSCFLLQSQAGCPGTQGGYITHSSSETLLEHRGWTAHTGTQRLSWKTGGLHRPQLIWNTVGAQKSEGHTEKQGGYIAHRIWNTVGIQKLDGPH